MKKIYAASYMSDKTAFALIWRAEPGFALLKLLLEGAKGFEEQINSQCPGITSKRSLEADALAAKIKKCIDFSNENLPLDKLDISGLGNFNREILLTLRDKVPPGKVISYSALAAKAGYEKAARAAGNAMGGNPFPLFLPCHRVVKNDRSMGNFGPGGELKHYLLCKEGVAFDIKGRIPGEYFVV